MRLKEPARAANGTAPSNAACSGLSWPHFRCTAATMTSVVVLDTNIVLDCWVFEDPATAPCAARCMAATCAGWPAAHAWSLLRVLGYPQIAPRLAHHGRRPRPSWSVLIRWRSCAMSRPRPLRPAKTRTTRVLDLAVAHRARLFSKDHAVL